MLTSRDVVVAALAALSSFTLQAQAQLRVASWNVTNYAGGRVSEFSTAIYGTFEGRSMAPDVLLAQELLSSGGVASFLAILNGAPGSPGDWAAAPFVNGNDTDNAFFYRTSRVQFLGQTVVSQGSSSPNHPRDVNRYDIRLIGYQGEGATLACYSSHMKAGSGSSDQQRRLVEAIAIRNDAESLPEPWHFLLGGDFNIQSSNQAAYIEMTGFQVNNDGRLADPIRTPGSWNNNGAFRIVHTQDPSGAGGMDDRHDQILVSETLLDGAGFDYIGLPVPYSTVTWNDPNHTYRAWGNDGSTYNGSLRITGNSMVGTDIALALVASASGGGHLPVFLDMTVPGIIDAPESLDFGDVTIDTPVALAFDVANIADASLWTDAGIAPVEYTMAIDGPFTIEPGPFEVVSSGTSAHDVMLTPTITGPLAATLTIVSDCPENPVLEIPVVANVVEACTPDINSDGELDIFDVVAFLGLFETTDPAADWNGDTIIDVFDVLAFLDDFDQGC